MVFRPPASDDAPDETPAAPVATPLAPAARASAWAGRSLVWVASALSPPDSCVAPSASFPAPLAAPCVPFARSCAPFASLLDPLASFCAPFTRSAVPPDASPALSMNSWSPATSWPATVPVPAALFGELRGGRRDRAGVLGGRRERVMGGAHGEEHVAHVGARDVLGRGSANGCRHLAGDVAQRIAGPVVRREAQGGLRRRSGGVRTERSDGSGELGRDRQHGGIRPVGEARGRRGLIRRDPREPAAPVRRRQRRREAGAQRELRDWCRRRWSWCRPRRG